MKGAHLHRRPPLPMPVQACIFIAGLILFGAGIAIAAADDHPDGRVSSVTAQSTTTTIEPTTRTTVQEMTTTTAPRPVGRTAAPVRSYAFKATAATSTVLETTTTTETPTTPLEIAQSQVGKTGAYAEGGFWCAKFVSWIAEQAKVSGFISRDGPSALYADAVADRRLTQEPVVGGMIFIDLFGPNGIGHGQVTHVGIVASVTGDELVIIQGNGKPDPSVVTRTTYKIGDGFVIAFAPFSRETSEHSDD